MSSVYTSVNQTLAFVLAGGKGSRLVPLTEERSKPAAPFGGRYRIIDFVLSNLINSGITGVYVMTQYMSQSLSEHLNDAWNFGNALQSLFVTPVPAQMRTGSNWYTGTADAVYQNINLIKNKNPEHMIVFGGDHIFLMDVRQMLEYSATKEADVCIACIPVPIEEASRFGVVQVDENWQIIGFQEKPDNPSSLPNDPSTALVSMGNYIFNTPCLLDYLEEDAAIETSSHDFGNDILPKMLKDGKKLFAYDFNTNTIPGHDKPSEYWRDVGTLEAYFDATMDLRSVEPELDIFNRDWPIRSDAIIAPPAKFVHNMDGRVGQARQSIISEGTIVSGGMVVDSIVGRNCMIKSYSYIDHCILMDDVTIGRGAQLNRCIVDKHVRIPDNMSIGFNLEKDREQFHITDDGIVVVAKNQIIHS